MQGFIPERSRNNQGQNTSKQQWQRQGKRVIHKTASGQGRQQNNQKYSVFLIINIQYSAPNEGKSAAFIVLLIDNGRSL